jgi:hypothetical protein
MIVPYFIAVLEWSFKYYRGTAIIAASEARVDEHGKAGRF